MTLFDRYVLGLFVKIMLVCFTSLAGLYLIIDVFNNLDDFIQISKRDGSMWRVLLYYYSPRLLGLFSEVSGLLSLLAAICTIARLQATQELAAVQAAGISVRRVAQPILCLSAVLCLAGLGARELVLPKFRLVLSMNAQEILRDQPRTVIAQIDYDSLIMFRGGEIDPVAGQIHEPELQLPPGWGIKAVADVGAGPAPANVDPGLSINAPVPDDRRSPRDSQQIKASLAIWRPATAQHPAGFLLLGVRSALGEPERHRLAESEKRRVLLPVDQPWLAADQCFVPTQLTMWQLTFGSNWFRSASLAELVTVNRSGSVRLPSIQRVEIHWRLLRPILDFLLVLMGLPLVLRPEGQKLVVAAGYCGLLMLGVQLLVMGSHFLGGQQLLRPAALAAWLPVLLTVPLAARFYQKFDF
jgi:lipopolysaccharide export system permease protein